MKEQEFNADYQERLVYANYGCVPIAHGAGLGDQEEEESKVSTSLVPAPSKPLSTDAFEWRIRILGSSVEVVASSPEHSCESELSAVILPISGAVLSLVKILAAVNRLIGVPVPLQAPVEKP